MIIKHCLICNSAIKAYPSNISSKKTCSKKCDYLLRKDMYKGKNNPAYKGGIATYTNGQGKTYRYIIGNNPKIPEHRYIMEKILGRPLKKGEEVHHINGDTLNNNPENLYIIDKKNHSRLHFELFKKVQQLEQENKMLKEKIILFSNH